MLDADRQAHEILGHAGAGELFRVELAVCRRRRMAGERFRVADIDQPQDHLERVDELCARFLSALDAEAQMPAPFTMVILRAWALKRQSGRAALLTPPALG